MSRPVVIISLDGMSWTVLDPLIAAGDLPTIAGLIARGARGTVRSVVPPITPAAWSSFMTGKHPGKHGIFDFRIYEPQAYRDSFVSSRALREPTVWEQLTAAGKRTAIVNLPVMYPPNDRSGTVVTGFDTPSVEAAFTHPPELRERLLARIPDYLLIAVPDPADKDVTKDETLARFVADVQRSFDQRTTIALDLLADAPWDVFMLHYQDTDIMQHRAWRSIEERDRFPARWEMLRQAYRRLDADIARVLAAVPRDALVLMLSDHGFGAHAGRLYPNVLLQRWGYLSWRGRRRTRFFRSVQKRLVRFGLASPKQRSKEPWIRQLRDRRFDRMLPLRWNRTRAYVALAEMYGLLYVNVRGREPEGIVAPGAEQRAVAEELRTRLLAVQDPRDGRPVFADVLHGDAVYPVDPLGRRPDLVLVPRPEYSVYRDLNLRLWLDHYPAISGTHRPEGIFVAAGDGVRPGALPAEISLVDFTPTILAASGLPVPEDVDGRVLSELFVEPPDVRIAPATGPVAREPGDLSDDEEGQVMDRLRALGYMQ